MWTFTQNTSTCAPPLVSCKKPVLSYVGQVKLFSFTITLTHETNEVPSKYFIHQLLCCCWNPSFLPTNTTFFFIRSLCHAAPSHSRKDSDWTAVEEESGLSFIFDEAMFHFQVHYYAPGQHFHWEKEIMEKGERRIRPEKTNKDYIKRFVSTTWQLYQSTGEPTAYFTLWWEKEAVEELKRINCKGRNRVNIEKNMKWEKKHDMGSAIVAVVSSNFLGCNFGHSGKQCNQLIKHLRSKPLG